MVMLPDTVRTLTEPSPDPTSPTRLCRPDPVVEPCTVTGWVVEMDPEVDPASSLKPLPAGMPSVTSPEVVPTSTRPENTVQERSTRPETERTFASPRRPAKATEPLVVLRSTDFAAAVPRRAPDTL
jgi:hypothetical protein